MPASRSYRTTSDPEHRALAVESLARSIFVEWNVRNLLVWENVRKPNVRHWRDDCPALRRAKHARSKLVPREHVELGRNCLTCMNMDAAARRRKAERRRREILALEPPPILALEPPPRALEP